MLDRLGILVSYGTFGEQAIDVLRPDWDVLLDSGAFANFKAGKDVVTLESYSRLLEEHGEKFWRYINLDRIGDPKGSQENFLSLRASGFAPVPVFQRGALIEQLYEMGEQSDLVAIGGIAGAIKRSHRSEYIAQAKRVADAKGIRTHLLGVGNSQMLTSHRPFSADSSDYANGQRFGVFRLWDSKAREFATVSRQAATDRHCAELLHSYGLSLSDIRERTWWARGSMNISILSTIRYAEHLAKLGTKYFMAIIASHLPVLRETWDEYVAARAA